MRLLTGHSLHQDLPTSPTPHMIGSLVSFVFCFELGRAKETYGWSGIRGVKKQEKDYLQTLAKFQSEVYPCYPLRRSPAPLDCFPPFSSPCLPRPEAQCPLTALGPSQLPKATNLGRYRSQTFQCTNINSSSYLSHHRGLRSVQKAKWLDQFALK